MRISGLWPEARVIIIPVPGSANDSIHGPAVMSGSALYPHISTELHSSQLPPQKWRGWLLTLGISLVKWCVCLCLCLWYTTGGDRRKTLLLSSFSQLEFCCDQDAIGSILDAQENCQHITQQTLLDQESQHSTHLSTAPSVANDCFSFALITLHST